MVEGSTVIRRRSSRRRARATPIAAALSLLLLLLAVAAQAATAAPSAAAPDQAPPRLAETSEAALARMSDAEVRAMLAAELARRAEASPPSTPLAATMSDRLATARTRVAELFASVREVPALLAATGRVLAGERPDRLLLGLAVFIPLIGLAGAGGEWAVRRLSAANARALRARGDDPDAAIATRVAAGGGLFLRELAATAAFVLAGLALLMALWQGYAPRRDLVLYLLTAYACVRGVAAFARLLLAPDDARLRLFDLRDDEARRLYAGLVRSAAIAAVGFLACNFIALAVERDTAHGLLSFAVGLAVVLSLAWTLQRARAGLRRNLVVDGTAGPLRRAVADAVPTATTALVVAVWPGFLLAYAFDVPLGTLDALATMALVVFVPHVDAVLARAGHEPAVAADDGAAVDEWGSLRLRVTRAALWLATAWVLTRIYAVDLQAVVAAGVGDRLSGALMDIVITVLLAYVAWETIRVVIDRRLAAEAGPVGAGERGDEGGTGASRLATLLPLFRVTLQVTVVTMALLIVLAAVGVNIGPLLAGAGVVGLAVGFGAQTLVRDIVSGLFFLVDDAFRTGEYIDVGAVKGTVEKISVRSLRLRHHRGYLHTIPFGEIQHLTNYSRDWVIMKLEFRVPFDTDIELVRKLFKQIGKELLQHPDIGDDFLEPFKSQGVYTMDDSAMIVRGKFTAKPGKQFMARREIYNAVQRAFYDHGIRFADRRVTVQVADADRLSQEEYERAVEAGAAAVPAPVASSSAAGT
jgi:small-conductance mechanosensitive channel